MADYYADYGKKAKKSGRNPMMWVIDSLLLLLTLIVGVTMVLTLAVPYINPGYMWCLPILGLGAPAVYVATVILALYWVIRWRWVYAGAMLTLVVVGLFKVTLFYKPEFSRVYPGEDNFDRATFKIMSYNIRSGYANDGKSNFKKVMQLIEQQDPDIICLQEFNARLIEPTEEFSQLEERYEKAVFGRTEAPDSVYGAPLVILSKYHILRSGKVLPAHTSVWADVLMGEDTVRVFNNHLRSTALKSSDNEYITNHGFLSDTASEVKLRSIVGRFRDNSILRAAQVDSIASEVGRTGGRRIICGDFNDTPMSYAYRTMAAGMRDAFREAGAGFSYTFRGFFNTLRIDYVLVSKDLEVRSYQVPQVDYSDHLPIFVQLKKKPLNN